MKSVIKAVRGMRDCFPPISEYISHIETSLLELASRYGYELVQLPVLESTGLFEKAVGVSSDIVSKEMFTFEDKGGDWVTLRPEGTAGCVRAGIAAGRLHNQLARFCYVGPMFRRERPQKGRYRQFSQVGLEAFGMSHPHLDAELIHISALLFDMLGLKDQVKLYINTIGSTESRVQYRSALQTYFKQYASQMNEITLQQLLHNPLRLLDSKEPQVMQWAQAAPKLSHFLDKPSAQHFEQLMMRLDQLGVPFEQDLHLVRGLDYYNKTVFEWKTEALGSQSTVCGGGRYDGLVALMGGSDTPAAGFAIGVDRIALLLEGLGGKTQALVNNTPRVFIVASEANQLPANQLAKQVRSAFPKGIVWEYHNGLQLSTQIRIAKRMQAEFIFCFGSIFEAQNLVQVLTMRDTSEKQVAQTSCLSLLKEAVHE